MATDPCPVCGAELLLTQSPPPPCHYHAGYLDAVLRGALLALLLPCEALLAAEAAGEGAGLAPVLSDALSRALKAAVGQARPLVGVAP